MLRSWKIGRMFGVDIFLHWSFWILPILFIWQLKAFTALTATLALVAVAFVVVFVVLHEFGHILVARAFGISTRDVILTPLGGMARMERMSEKPGEEILIALAGPAVNVVGAALISIGMTLFSVAPSTFGPTLTIASGRDLLTWLLLFNIMMVVFNMLPAFPMDGGRVLRGTLAAIMDRVTATKIAVYLGTAVIGFVGLGLFLANNYLALPLAVFIAFVGHMELAMVKRKDAYLREQARLQEWRDEIVEPEEVVVPGLPPEPGFSGYSWNAGASAWIEWRDGQPVRACRMRAG